ncbi:MAG: 1,4-alpha-glucan branching enzyme [Elusimicrobia bacterium GWA2_61_42]|nr:MAG: 1,4-alpha-glucan branching enzyme [Elusimicrobia bacterium GWA2_61_42]OGR76436.1 MAG: 1,4-alpha-glucan branching enzyme [Elusimicrobia bacterium GWC2_61_25]
MPELNDAHLITDQDIYLFNEGNHLRLYEKLGAHPASAGGKEGTRFAVWAPNARQVFVMGDFNAWSKTRDALRERGRSGIWEGFIPGVVPGQNYKYYIVSRYNGFTAEKADPAGFTSEVPPKTSSVVGTLDYAWGDEDWMKARGKTISLKSPVSIYEVHLGSWRRVPEEGNRSLTYRETAEQLPAYAREMGFSHVELMPVTEHPFYGSWGYQTTGYFAPTSRYGSPQDFMFLVDRLHQAGIGVILDWVPAHFPADAHGLAYFDGTHLYEHADPKQGFHPDWKSSIFNFGRNEVRSFLLSSAMFWLDKYHADGLRVDAVASMLYLDYSRKPGEWVPNRYGGNENLEAIAFLKQFNQVVYQNYPDVQTYAEESTAWPMVSRPTHLGGLGFGLKWDMGWMHDTLDYFARDPVYRKYHHNSLTFRLLYAFGENFTLPLSHDEVVHGKGSLLDKMAGDEWQKFANLRLLYGGMFAQPGQKLMFMGDEFAQRSEWRHEASLDWHLAKTSPHAGVRAWVRDLNRLYAAETALHELNCSPAGFEWVDANDSQQSVLAFLRKGERQGDVILAVCNFTSVPRHDYQVGVPRGGFWKELLNSDAAAYWGSGVGNLGGSEARALPVHGRPYSLRLTLPPLSIVFLKCCG